MVETYFSPQVRGAGGVLASGEVHPAQVRVRVSLTLTLTHHRADMLGQATIHAHIHTYGHVTASD